MEIGREQEEFHFDGEAMSKAVSILAMIQGARQMARVHGLDYLERIFDQIRTDLGIKD
jgi:acetyl-CoA carboxylase alpha subunit